MVIGMVNDKDVSAMLSPYRAIIIVKATSRGDGCGRPHGGGCEVQAQGPGIQTVRTD